MTSVWQTERLMEIKIQKPGTLMMSSQAMLIPR